MTTLQTPKNVLETAANEQELSNNLAAEMEVINNLPESDGKFDSDSLYDDDGGGDEKELVLGDWSRLSDGNEPTGFVANDDGEYSVDDDKEEMYAHPAVDKHHSEPAVRPIGNRRIKKECTQQLKNKELLKKHQEMFNHKELSDTEILSLYTPLIKKCLKGNRIELACVGVLLCKAKDRLARQKKMTSKQEKTFTKWYEDELGISPNQARLWMRWVRPVMDIVDWENDNDPILVEICSVGPHLFDEVTKLPEDNWFINEAGVMIVRQPEIGDIPAKDLSVRLVRAIRDSLNPAPERQQAAETTAAAPAAPPAVADNNPGITQTENVEPNDKAAAPEPISDNVDTVVSEVADTSEAPHDDNGHTPEDVVSDIITEAEVDNDNQAEDTENTPSESAVKDSETVEDSENDPWAFYDTKDFRLSVLGCMPKVDKRKISGVNVRMTFDGEKMEHQVIDPENDAFYSVKTENQISLFWYEHRTQKWFEAQVIQNTAPDPASDLPTANVSELEQILNLRSKIEKEQELEEAIV